MCTMRCSIHSFPTANLCHPPYSSASQAWILIAVTPAIHRPLNQPPFPSQTWVELCQCPAHSVALCLVVQSVALVLVFGTAGTWVHTVLCLELWWKCVCVYRLNVATNRVFHLHSVSRVLERNPLHAILVLSNDKRCCGRNWPRGSVGINSRGAWWTLMHLWGSLGRLLWWAHACGLSLKLLLRLHLLTWTSSKTRRNWVRCVLERLHRASLGHEVGVQRTWLLCSWMSTIRRRILHCIWLILIHWLLWCVRVDWSALLVMLRRLNRSWRGRLWCVVTSHIRKWIPVHSCGRHSCSWIYCF